jgi:hypothetical protein
MFDRQQTATMQLPDPQPLVGTLAGAVLEVIAGVRDVEPYLNLVMRANLAARARSARGEAARQPAYSLQRVLCSSPADGIVEATAIVVGPVRTRAIPMRLEGYDNRWRATSIAIL